MMSVPPLTEAHYAGGNSTLERLLQLVMVTPGALDGFAKESMTSLWPCQLSLLIRTVCILQQRQMWIPKIKRTEKSPWASGFVALMDITVWITPWSLIVIRRSFRALHSGERNSEFTDDYGKRRVFINFIMLKHGWRGIWTMHMGCYKEFGGGSLICLEQIYRITALCGKSICFSGKSLSPPMGVLVVAEWCSGSMNYFISFKNLSQIFSQSWNEYHGLLQSIFTVKITLRSK